MAKKHKKEKKTQAADIPITPARPVRSLIITHGNLGEELIRVSERILGHSVDIDCMGFDWEEDGSHIIQQLDRYLEANRQHPIIIFTDMFGGSPSNICLRYINSRVEVITGVNLPGMLKYLSHKDHDITFQELVATIKQGTIDGINVLGEYVGDKRK